MVSSAYQLLRASTKEFGDKLRKNLRFNYDSVKQSIDDALESWEQPLKGVAVNQRRGLNGRYRFFHDEPVLQSILLRHIGMEWSVHVSRVLTKFRATKNAWKASSKPVPQHQKLRRKHFLGSSLAASDSNVDSHKVKHFDDEVFLEQLARREDEIRAGYDDESSKVGDTRKSHMQIMQKLLRTGATEIIMKNGLEQELVVINFFRRVLEAPVKFSEDGPNAEGSEKNCVEGWDTLKQFTTLMGLEVNEKKTGSAKIHGKAGETCWLPPSLPEGEVKAWNNYARLFGNHSAIPANCFGREHVDMLIDTFARIQESLFAGKGGNATSALSSMISTRFSIDDILEGFLYAPSDDGGLEVKNPLINLNLVRNNLPESPDQAMKEFNEKERRVYREAKSKFESGVTTGASKLTKEVRKKFAKQPFMSFEEYIWYREQTSADLLKVYIWLLSKPKPREIVCPDGISLDVEKFCHKNKWRGLHKCEQRMIEIYREHLVRRFGGLTIVGKGWLSKGFMSVLRDSRLKLQD
ncbi:hypothetical protein G7Y89_g12678 [Cudoniella acicularis]|uniref:Uncharacterized protein n=1 Tax=Cudoniella acicularis TaxID=354080 RepID=A0A8H4RAS0_9HELO|nr:hypothetical protein G7Y89_g12678 [Cudoniella acicularis]